MPGRDLGIHLIPVADVGRVDCAGPDASPAGRVDLVAHEREQRGDDHRRPGAAGSQQRGRGEVDGRLAPAGPLDDQRANVVGYERPDGRPLVLAEACGRASQCAQPSLGLLAERLRRIIVARHMSLVSGAADSRAGSA